MASVPTGIALPEGLASYALTCVTVTSIQRGPDYFKYTFGNGFLASCPDSSGGLHYFALTAAHVLAGYDEIEVTIRSPGLDRGMGRIVMTLGPGPGVVYFPQGGSVDAVAIRLDEVLDRNAEARDVVALSALPSGALAASAGVREGDSLFCLVRPVDPILWYSVGEIRCVGGRVMPRRPEERDPFVDLEARRGYSGSLMLRPVGPSGDSTVVEGMLVAMCVEVVDPFLDPSNWHFVDPCGSDQVFAELVPISEILGILRPAALASL